MTAGRVDLYLLATLEAHNLLRVYCSTPWTMAEAVPPYVSRGGGTASREVEGTFAVKKMTRCCKHVA